MHFLVLLFHLIPVYLFMQLGCLGDAILTLISSGWWAKRTTLPMSGIGERHCETNLVGCKLLERGTRETLGAQKEQIPTEELGHINGRQQHP